LLNTQVFLLITRKKFFFMPVTAEPLLFMPDSILLWNMHGAKLTKYHVALFYFGFGLSFAVFAVIFALTGLEVLDHAPKHPDYQSKNNESDQAHKKSL
jgi:hypothetical protein